MTDWNAVSAFMANVVAWPASPQDAGHVNLHYSMTNPRPTPGKPLIKGMGWPFKTVDELVGRASWLNTTSNMKDAWFCTSLQEKAALNSKGKPKAVRLAANALAVKSIWVDIDVGPDDPKKYATVEEALAAILLFQKTVGLPPPSAIVFSGGGLHVYWISKTPLTPEQWAPYAGGLRNLLLANAVKCDSGLTTDIARILRVPGTFNHKYDPPKPVQLSPLPLVMYDFSPTLDFLKPFSGPVTVIHAAAAPALFADGVDPATFGKPHPLFAGLTDTLGAGVTHESPLLKAGPIFKQCGFFKEALMTGGVNFGNELWMYSVLGSTFMENGNAIAHALSKGHLTYSEVDTQALYDRKMVERADRGIGYPSCSKIAGAGCTSCATCPLFSKGKSPLNIRPPVTATVNPVVQTANGVEIGLPIGFDLNDDGYICKIIEKEGEDGEILTSSLPLFQCQLSGFWLQKTPGEHMNFIATMDKGFSEMVSVDMGEVSSIGFSGYLGKKRVLINKAGKLHLEEFFLSMIGKLRAFAAAQQSVPFGWFVEGGKTRGFAYGGRVFMDDGTERPCGVVSPNFAALYSPCGELGPWLAAAKTVTDRKRPELTTIMLMSFASPLLYLNGKNTGIMSAWGSDSGAGKSSAYRVGISVWGHPQGTKVTERDTPNSILSSMKNLRHLPFYWDEITNDDDRKKFKAVMHQLDGGKDKARMENGKDHQAAGMMKMMLHYASNGSLLEFLRQDNMNTVASQMRVLEWEVKKVDNGPGQLMDADAEALLDECDRNFGNMGVKYAMFLAANHAMIKDELRNLTNHIQTITGGKNGERYWYTSAAVLTLAAKYAKLMGLDVDPDEIEKFMLKVYADNLDDRDRYNSGGNVDNSEDMLTRYLRDRDSEQRTVWSNYMQFSRGKPPKPVILLKAPSAMQNYKGAIAVRFAVENSICVISKGDFDGWLATKKQARTQIYMALTKAFGMEIGKLQLCSGWVQDPGREFCIVLHLRPGTPLHDYMISYVPPEVRSEVQAPKSEMVFEQDKVTKGFVPPVKITPDLDTAEGRSGLMSPDAVQAWAQGATGRA